MRVRFYAIPNSKKSRFVTIYASVSHKSRRVFVNTNISVEKSNFDSKKQRIKPNHPNCIVLNRKLNEIETKIYEVFHSQPIHQPPDITLNKIKEFFVNEHQLTLVDLFDAFIETKKSTNSENYIQTIAAVKSEIQAFAPAIKPLELDARFVDKFVNHLITRNYLNNSIKVYITLIRVVLNWSFGRYIPRFDLSFLKFKAVENETTFSLTVDEIKALMRVAPETPLQQKVIDAFLFACFTGLRISDVIRFSKQSIIDGFIEIRQTKTKRPAHIVLLEPAAKIINKYHSDKPFEDVNRLTTSPKLRAVAKKAGLNRLIKTYVYKGNEKIEKLRPVYELITFHTARRSFVTLLASLNVNPELIKAMTGHTTQQEYERYHIFAPEHLKGLSEKLQGFLN